MLRENPCTINLKQENSLIPPIFTNPTLLFIYFASSSNSLEVENYKRANVDYDKKVQNAHQSKR